jgi:beta-galactosidase GanA
MIKKLPILFFTGIFILSLLSCNRSSNPDAPESKNTDTISIPHLEKQGTATRLVVNGKPFLLIAGELHNSSAGGFEYMRPIWKRMAAKNLNSVIATASWEMVEPEEGKYDFTLIDSAIAGAREANLKLVLIWFGSWKNASSVYIPSWVKKNYDKYPRANEENGKSIEILSTFGEASCQADAKAFAALMKHIKEVDSKEQTVVMMQVENEVGIMDNLGKTPGNARRDFSNVANEAYNSEVPKELISYLEKNKENLHPELYKIWKENGFKTSGSWEEVFGKSSLKPDKKDWQFYSYYTEELFMAWNYGKYVEKVAAAGKKEYPIPMYVNAWLKQPFSYLPGKYPSGGPLPQVIDVWRSAAPSIDFLSPDIYMDEFTWACSEYVKSGNPLFIPETVGGELGAARVFYAIGAHDASCFAPFGIDNPRYAENDPLDESYAVLQKMTPVILENQGKGTMRGILVDSITPTQKLEIGDYIVEAKLGGRQKTAIAGGLLIQTGKDEFIVTGRSLDIFFILKDSTMRIGADAVDEGTFKNGKWITERRLNGDEVHASTWSGTGPKLPGDKVSIQKISLYRYK